MFVLSVLPVAASLAAWFTPAAATVQPVCSTSTLSNFKLNALFTDPALNVGLPADGFPITGTFAAVDGLAFYSVLTSTSYWSPWETYKLNNGALELTSSNFGYYTESLHVNPGNSPAFKSYGWTSPGPNEWCAMPTDSNTEPLGQTLPALQLAVHNTPGLFSLCTNTSASDRQDLVFQQGATYEPKITDCKKVTLFVIPV